MELMAARKDIAYAQGEWDEVGAWGRARRIQAAMHAAGASKATLAKRLGLSENTVAAWALGDKDPDWSRWISIATALDLPGGELWEPPVDALIAADKTLDRLRPDLRHSAPMAVRKKETRAGSEGS